MSTLKQASSAGRRPEETPVVPIDSIHAWAKELQNRLPLSRPQAWVLALWSVGVVLTGRCGQSVVSHLLASLLHRKPDTVRQRLREFTYEAGAKRGEKRRALAVEPCFEALLRWVLALWAGKRLALALDATSLKQDFVVLSVSVLFRGAAVPVAWRVLRGAAPEAWKPHWLSLLAEVRAVVPADFEVLALTDRGLYAPWLFEALVAVGFHPFMRINAGGFFCPDGDAYRPLASFAPVSGTDYRGRGLAFKEHPVSCTLLAHWEPGYEEAWRLLTDLEPEQAEASWYGLRGWIEQGFKDLKRGGWHWHLTRMRDPDRVQRFWLVLSVATLWMLATGAPEDEAAAPAPTPAPARPRRRLSVFRQGWLRAVAAFVRNEPYRPPARLTPEPWPRPFGAADWRPG